MIGKSPNISRNLVILCSACIMLSGVARADNINKEKSVFSLPSNIAQKLRDSNSPDQQSCDESNIFIHGFEYLELNLNRLIWFLGAPDYSCRTNSFIPVIVDSSGKWTAGKSSGQDWRGSDLLDGVPRHFRYAGDLGFLLITEWQIEGSRTLMYYSQDGMTWTSLDLPTPKRKDAESDCCYAPSIRALCLVDSGNAYISYEESSRFYGSAWVAPVNDAFPNGVDWIRVQGIPEDADCSGPRVSEFIPYSLREKTEKGAIFDVALDWAVRIPGPTK